MRYFNLTLVRREEVAERTFALSFTKPPSLSFRAGQYLSLIAPGPHADPRGNERSISIASAPHENLLEFVVRDTGSAFKQNLLSFEAGETIQAAGPFGSFVLHDNPEVLAVFISGGVGISPARSILRHAAAEKLPHRIRIFYANRRIEDAPFLDELLSLKEGIVVPLLTQPEGTSWNGEVGYMSAELLRRYMPTIANAVYYVSGPTRMVLGVEKTLRDSGIDSLYIKTEEFTGY